jgi:hypothetical protein
MRLVCPNTAKRGHRSGAANHYNGVILGPCDRVEVTRLAMPFTESLVRFDARRPYPSPCLQNESTATAESGRGIVLRANGFRVQRCRSPSERCGSTVQPRPRGSMEQELRCRHRDSAAPYRAPHNGRTVQPHRTLATASGRSRATV